LFEIIREIHPKKIMEIGVWNGDRGVQMINYAQKYSQEKIQYYGSDLFEEMNEGMMETELSKFPPTREQVEIRLQKTGADIELIAGNTLISLPKLVEKLSIMDFVFIDGGHAVETIANDWKYVSLLMDEGSVVIFDDYYPDRDDVGAKAVVEKIDKDIYDVSILDVEDIFKKEDGILRIRFAEVRKK
jgi:predicted O-methyltransferase YrrM